MNTPLANPYIGPRTFMKEERHLFFGRDREARDLVSLVVSHRLVLFYAQSGAGKSSIINTRLIPELEERRFEVFPVGRVSGDFAPEGVDSNVYTYNLMRKLIQHEADADALAGLSISEFLANLNSDDKGYFYDPQPPQNRPEGDLQWRHALIIDQFEELFSTHPEAWERREDFFCQLADAMNDDPYLWVVLVMREDYIASLDPYAHLLPDGLKVRYYMQRLGREAALKAIRNPVTELRPYAPNVAEKLVDDLCSIKVQNPDGSQGTQPGQYVEPVQLQVVCYSLWENLEGGAEITEDDIRKVGDVDKALGTYYAGRVKSVAANEKLKVTENAIRRWFETSLITEGGIRNMVLQEPNKKSGGLLDDAVIQALQSDLVRAEKRSGATWYELTHDRLVEPILTDNRVWFEQNASLLQRQAKLWNDQARNTNLLLRDQAFVEAKQWAQEHDDELREYERDFIKASQEWQEQLEKQQMIERMKLEQAEEQARSAMRARRLTRIAFSLLGLALIAVGFAAWAAVRARTEAERASNAEDAARESAATANELASAALARELASQAGDNLNQQLDLAILLGLEAYNRNLEIPDAALIPQVENTLFDNIQRSLRLRGYLATSQDPALQFVYSPDGNHAAVLQEDGLTLWDIDSGLTPHTVPGTDSVTQYFFSPDSSKLIYLDRNGLTFRDMASLEKLNESPINRHQGAILDIIFSADSNSFATVGENGDITLWDMTAGDIPLEIPSFDVEYAAAHAFSPSGLQFAVLDRQGLITLYSLVDGTPQGEPIEMEPDTVTALAFSQAGDVLAIGDKNGIITLWDIASNAALDSFSHPSQSPGVFSIQSILFRFDDSFLVYRTEEGVTTWNLTDRTVAGKTISVNGELVYSANGRVFAELDAGAVLLHDVPETKLHTITGTDAVFNAEGTVLAVFNESDGNLTLIDVATGEPIGEPFSGLSDSVVSMTFSREGDRLAVVTADGSSRIWEVQDRRLQLSIALDESNISALAFSPDGNQLVQGSTDSSFIVWNQVLNETEKVETDYEGRITSAVLSPTGQYLYTVARDGIELIDVQSSRPIRGVFPGASVHFSPDENFFVTIDKTGGTGVCTLYRLPSGGRVRGGLDCTSVTFSSQGNKVALTLMSEDGTGKTTLLHSDTGAPIGVFDSYDLKFSPDEKLVTVYDSNTGFSRLGDAETGAIIPTPEGTNPVAFSPSGDVVVLTDYGYLLRLLDISTGEIIAEAANSQFIGFAPNGATILVQDFTDGSITFRRVKDFEPIGEPITNLIYGGSPMLSPSGETFTLSAYNGTTIWDMTTRKQIGSSQTPVTFSPDGNYAISTDSYSPTKVWNLSTGEVLDLGPNHSFVAFTPDSKYVLMNDFTYYYGFTFWSLSTGRQVGGVLAGHAGLLYGGVFDETGNIPLRINNGVANFYDLVAPLVGDPMSNASGFLLSPNEETYAVLSSADGSISLWNVEAPPSIPGEEILNLDADVEYARLSPDGKTLALATSDGISIWDQPAGTQLGELDDIHIRPPSYVELTPDAHFMVVVYTDYSTNTQSLSVWDVSDLKQPKQIGESIPEALLVLSPTGDTLVTAPFYRTFNLWKVSTGKMIGQSLVGEHVIYSRDGRFLLIYDFEVCKIHDTSTGLQVGELPCSTLMGMGPGDHTIVTQDESGIYFRDMSELDSYKSYFQADGSSYYTLSPDGRYLVELSKGPVLIQDIETREQVGRIDGPSGDFRGFSPDGEFIYFYDYEQETYLIYQMLSPNLQINKDPVAGDSLLFNSESDLFAAFYSYYYYYPSASSDADITFYSMSTGKELDDINIPGNLYGFGDDGKLIVMMDNGEINLWSAKDLTSDPIVVEYSGILNSMTLSADGSSLVVYGSSGVMLVDLSEPEQTAAWVKETTGQVQQMVFSPDGAILATIGNDGLILWDVASRSPISETISSKHGIVDVSFRPDSKSVIYQDGTGDLFEIELLSDQTVSQQTQLEASGNLCNMGFDLNNNLLTVRQSGRTLEIYNVDTKETIELDLDGICGNPMAFSADGKSFAYNEGNRIYVFTPDEQGTAFGMRREIVGDPYYYIDLNFVLDDKILALADYSRRIYFWDIENRALMFVPQQGAQLQTVSNGQVLVFLPAENRLITMDLTPESLRRSFDSWKDELCSKVGRNFSDTEWQQYFPGDDFAPTCPVQNGN